MSETTMAQPPSMTADRVGPFQAGSTSADLIGLAGRDDLGLRVLSAQDQKTDYFKARCEALEFAAGEFFYDYAGASSLILQKTRDSSLIPDFIEYIYCWLLEDRLCGLILSGVSSDAGSHDQINQQEDAFWGHTAEVALALSEKYPETPEFFVNFLDFETYSAPPEHPGLDPASLFTSYERLVGVGEDGDAKSGVETHYCGPSLILPSRKKPDAEIATAGTHSSQATRKFFANEDFLVIYDFKLERYVRTIESLHDFTNLIYISRKFADDLGRNLNARRCAEIQAEAGREVGHWRETIRRAEEARRDRISRLSQIL
jgi:hypothetical protein